MLFKYFYDEALAHASYMVGCQKTDEAIIVDPGRDVEQYLEAAAKEGMKIVGVADTHIHADYVSGARELADRIGAKLYVSDEGSAEWKYEYAHAYYHQLLKEGDTFHVGKVEFKVMHTPGHTPESISFILTDKGGGADKPMGIFTGDFVFVGSIGRPDLLEEAAGIEGTAEPGARDLFRSIQRFNQLPDYLQVWPTHGAGSACGKGLGAIPSSTVGYEKMFNPALQYEDEEAFVDYILSEQPETPKYFATMKRVNKEGPALLGGLALPEKKDTESLLDTVSEYFVADTATSKQFAEAHVGGTVSLQPKYIAMWGGSILDYDEPLYLISSKTDIQEAVRVLHKIGMDNIAGYFDADEVTAGGFKNRSFPQQTLTQLKERYLSGEIELVDIRGKSERRDEFVPESEHVFLGKMLDQPFEYSPELTYAFLCRTGGQSIIAASIAERSGLENIINVKGGVEAWKLEQMPIGEAQQAESAA